MFGFPERVWQKNLTKRKRCLQASGTGVFLYAAWQSADKRNQLLRRYHFLDKWADDGKKKGILSIVRKSNSIQKIHFNDVLYLKGQF